MSFANLFTRAISSTAFMKGQLREHIRTVGECVNGGDKLRATNALNLMIKAIDENDTAINQLIDDGAKIR